MRAIPTEPASAQSPALPVWLAATIICAALLAAYARTFAVPFLFDDEPSITENASIRDLAAWSEVLSPPSDTGRTVNGRPVLNLTFALNYAIGGRSVAGYHVTNLLIHGLASLTLFGVVRRTLAREPIPQRFRERATVIALGVALTWGLHPLHTSAVTYIAQRAESLMGLCYLFTLYSVVRSAHSPKAAGWQWAAVVAGAVGMGTKESMVTAPLVIAVYDRALLAGSWRELWRRRGWTYVGLVGTWLILAWLVISSGARGGTAGWAADFDRWEYAAIQVRAVIRYLGLALWPNPLIFDYGDSAGAAPLETLLAGGLVAGLLMMTVLAWRRRSLAGLAGFWFFAVLAPTTSIVPVATQLMAEHRMYLPLAAVISCGVVALHGRLKGAGSRVIWVAAIALGLATAARNETYRDAFVLWRDTVAKRPENARAHYNCGLLAAEAGHASEAITRFAEVVRLRPRDVEARNKLAVALLRVGQLDEALGHLAEALRLQPGYADAHNNLGVTLARIGRSAEAAAHFETVVRLRPSSFEAQFNLANVLAQLGRRAEAIAAYERAGRLEPGHAGVRQMLQRLGEWPP